MIAGTCKYRRPSRIVLDALWVPIDDQIDDELDVNELTIDQHASGFDPHYADLPCYVSLDGGNEEAFDPWAKAPERTRE